VFPTAQFAWIQANPCDPIITFSDTSFAGTGDTLAGWNWDFGDGSTSSAASPQHTYGGPGPWTVTLTVTDDDGQTDVYVGVVTLCVPPTPAFYAVLMSPCDTHDPYLQFIDDSSDSNPGGAIVARWWTFGDGGYASDTNPFHTYGDVAGAYSVTLQVMNNMGSVATLVQQVQFPGFVGCPIAGEKSQDTHLIITDPLDGTNIQVAQRDEDGDGIQSATDDCPTIADAAQSDRDGDGQGDACDLDIDNDGRLNDADNCFAFANADQVDSDGDGLGDACDDDLDNDGIADAYDVCPTVPDPAQLDSNQDGLGDACTLQGQGLDGAQVPLAGSVPTARSQGSDATVAHRAGLNWLPLILVVGGLAVLGVVLTVVFRRKA
jgi:hypothetical protein